MKWGASRHREGAGEASPAEVSSASRNIAESSENGRTFPFMTAEVKALRSHEPKNGNDIRRRIS